MKSSWDEARDPLAALAAGDPGPFEAFVRDEAATFLGFFRRLGAPPGEAEDLVQEVFLKLFQHADSYRPTGRFEAFAFRVARNAWIDRRRRQAAAPAPAEGLAGAEADGPEPVDAAEGPGVALERREEAARLRAALAQLPEHHRLVFELGVFQERPYAEIAEVLGIPVGTVKSRMFHAVRRLRELLGVKTR